ncbi:Major Facilitator Superfamily transporter [Sphaerochaeta pleomorpha str. Grapes]|uniref:Major Facilitator Superfamily transporter n=1 Tax=Sphaerochaeta pleomorpha (strain ATCC BAA-1885 / DSM 22778 / Grapes) TaxID=158190 RepID=G8QRS0_SPHPG|nr:MFS transporter [Sphaerochaeta pleomorpha]AEV28853.1 Major Facilitator Superfamily transporter [Sphaerochaeta pleomorpha str. Grapes]
MKKSISLSLYKGLPQPIYVLFFATVINGIGIFVYPFLALYLTQRLHYSAWEAGRFMTFASVLYIPGSFIGSKLADSFGRKPVMVVFQLLMDFCFILCGFLEGSAIVPYLVLLGLFFDGAVDPAREALKTDVTNQENRQVSFSLIYLGHNLGYACGPVIAGYLFYKAPQWIFWGNALAGIFSIILVLAKVKESNPTHEQLEESKKSNSTEKAEDGGLLKALLTRPTLLLFAFFVTFYSFAYSQTLFALPLWTTELFQTNGATIYGLMMTVNALVVVFFTPLFVSALRSNHPLLNTAIAGLLYALGFSLLALAKVPTAFYLLAVVFTFGEIISATNEQFHVANNTPMSHRARFSAILPIIMGTGHAIAPMVAGTIIEKYSMGWVWITAGASALFGALGITSLYLYDCRKKKKKALC